MGHDVNNYLVVAVDARAHCRLFLAPRRIEGWRQRRIPRKPMRRLWKRKRIKWW
jgi:hypothetical protein